MMSTIQIIDTIDSISKEIKKQLKESGNIKREIKNTIVHEISRLEALIPSIEKLQPSDGSTPPLSDANSNIRTILREELSEFTKLLRPNNVSEVPTISYAAAVKTKIMANKNVTAKPAIIIGAKDGTNCRHTDILNSFRKGVTFKDTTYAPAKIVPVSNNKVRVEFDTIEQRDVTMRKLSEVTDLKAENARNKRPLVILKGISNEIPVSDLVNIIINQNASISAEIKHDDDIIYRFGRKNRRNPETLYNAVLEVSGNVRNAMITLERINIDFQRVNVSDFSAFIQCFKCLQFGHTKTKCTDTTTPCSHCASKNHQYADCPEKNDASKLKCFNCALRNEKTNVKVDEKHSAVSAKHCPQIKSMQQRINSRIEYGC